MLQVRAALGSHERGSAPLAGYRALARRARGDPTAHDAFDKAAHETPGNWCGSGLDRPPIAALIGGISAW